MLYVKYKLVLNWAYMKYKALEFNEIVDREDVFKVSYWWFWGFLEISGIVGVNYY